jgi:two-component system sensor histidine kinase KdpD
MRTSLHRFLTLLGTLACLALAQGIAQALDPRVDLANLAMIFVLASTLVAFWLPAWASALFALTSVALFNWSFVPPRGSFQVDLSQHALLLGTLLTVCLTISALIARLRRQASLAARRAREAEQIQRLGDVLRAAQDPQTMAEGLDQALADLSSDGTALMLLHDELPATDDPLAAQWRGIVLSPAEQIGLWLCLRDNRAFGAGTGLHSELPAWYLPIRGPQAAWGATLFRLDPLKDPDPDLQRHAQMLCDLLGQALHRHHLERRTAEARAEAEAQKLRSALLAAISHDFRTPLASILGAASSLASQSERLSENQRRTWLDQIQDETRALTAMADNTLQLVRLEAGNIALRLDWESLEELVGAVLARVRQRDPQRRIRARLEPSLPLIRVDAPLFIQLLENLLDNALKYSPADAGPVDLVVRVAEDTLLLAVKDRGPGVPVADRTRIFDMFQRGQGRSACRGSGLGLAVCRAIAQAHGGSLSVRMRGHGGSSFELRLPLQHAPDMLTPAEDVEVSP